MHAAMVTTSRPHRVPFMGQILMRTNDDMWLRSVVGHCLPKAVIEYSRNDVGAIEQLLVDDALFAFGTHPG